MKNAARFIKFLDALVLVFAWLGIGLLIWLLACVVDHWLVSLSPVARWSIWSVGVAGTAWWLWRHLLPLLIHRINPIYAAHRIEHLVPEFKNGLISWLELESMPDAGVPRGVMAAIRYRAARFIGGQDPSATVDTTLLIKWMGAVALLCASLVVYAMVSPKSALATGQRILMPWASLASPTRVQFVSVEPGSTEVTQGKPLEVEVETRGLYFEEPVFVRFDTLDGQLVDQRVQLQSLNQGYRYAGTVTTSSTGVEHELRYWIEAGDAEAGPYQVRLNPLPSVTLDAIELEFPEYTQLESRIVSAGNGIEAVEGTVAKLRGSANQPLKRGRLEVDPQLDEEGRLRRASAYVKLDTDQKQLSGDWLLVRNEAGDNPTRYRYRLRGYNPRGDVNPRPVLHAAEVFADNPPEITLMGPEDRLLQVAPTARLRLEVRAVDPDFGLTAVNLRIAKNGEELASQRLLEDEAGQRGQRVLEYDLDVRKYDAQIGDEFQLLAVAHDNRHAPLNKQLAPNVTRSKQLAIQIVEPEQADEDSERLSNAGSDPSDSGGDEGTEGASGADGDRSATSSGSDTENQAGDPSGGSEESDSTTDDAPEQASGDQGGTQTDRQPAGDQPEEETGSQSAETSGEESPGGAESSGAQGGGEQASGSDATDSNGSGTSANNQESQASSQNDPAASSRAGKGGESGDASNDSRGAGQGGEPNDGDSGGEGEPGENTDSDAPTGNDASATASGNQDGTSGANPSNAEPSAEDRQTLDRIQEFMERQQASGDAADPNQSGQKQADAQQPDQNSPDRPQGTSSKPPSDVGEESQERASGDDSNGSQSTESDSPAHDRENEKDPAGNRSPAGDPQADASSRGAADSGEASDADSSGNRDGSSNAGEDDRGTQSTPSSGSDASSGDATDSSSADNNQRNESGSGGENGSDRDVNQGDDGKATDETGAQSESKSSTRDSESGDASQGADSQASDNASSDSQGAEQSEGQSTDDASSGSESEEGSQSDSASDASSDSQSASGETQQAETPQQSSPTEKDGSADKRENQLSPSSSEQAESSDSASSGSNDTSSPSAAQGSESESGSQQSSSESSAGGSESAQPGQIPQSGGAPAEGGAGGDAGPADAAKREYTDRNTDMILDYLDRQRDQPDPELLEEMSWTKDDLNNFVQRWKNARDLSQAEAAGDTVSGRDSLRPLGATSRPSDALRGTDVNDALRKQQDGGDRIRPPERLRKQYEAFQRALQNQDG